MESTRKVSLSEDRVADQSDEFVVTRELRKRLEEAIAVADAGKLTDFSVVQEQLSQYGAQWRESNGKSSR